MDIDDISGKAIGAAIEVHRHLGPGLLESAYQQCLLHELDQSGLWVEQQKPMPVIYKTVKLDHGYRMDFVLENKLVIEIKCVEYLSKVHNAQLLTYLRLGEYKLGLLINFHVKLLKNGIKRLIN